MSEDLKPIYRLVNHLGYQIDFFSEIDSTNLELIRRAKNWLGDNKGLVISADWQTQGRGRWGRSWQAKPGSSLLVSVLVKPELDLKYLGLVPISAGIAMVEAIKGVSGFEPGLVWPNDLYGNKGKIAGILVESVFEAGRLKFLVIGSGVNLVQKKADFPEDFRAKASSLLEEGVERISREELLYQYIFRLDFWRSQLKAQNYKALIEHYSRYDIIRGKEIKVFKDNLQIIGSAMGIDPEGRLRVKVEGKEVLFSAGEVRMIREGSDVISD